MRCRGRSAVPGVDTPGFTIPPRPGLGTCDAVAGAAVPGVDTPGFTIPPHPGLGTCDAVAGAAVPGVDTPDYDLFVREITARNNPFHQPSIVQFPREYRFHMARTS